MKKILLFMTWLLPSFPFKNALLSFLGHKVDRSARLHSNVVLNVSRFEVGPNAVVGPLNFIRNMNLVSLGEGAYLGKRNEINSHPGFNRNYQNGGVLVLEAHSKVTNLHWLDCSAGIFIGRFSSIAGRDSILMSHSVDLVNNAQRGRPIKLEDYVFVGVRCTLLGGAYVPQRSVVGAGAVVVSSLEKYGSGFLYGGSPAKPIREIDGEWFRRTDGHTLDLMSLDGETFWRGVI